MVGIDIVETARIRRALDRWGQPYLRRIFTSREIAYCLSKADPPQHFAARFAAKEAVFKALGARRPRAFSWRWIEVLNDEDGKPFLCLSERFRAGQSDSPGPLNFHVSITHTTHLAAAVVVTSADMPADCSTLDRELSSFSQMEWSTYERN